VWIEILGNEIEQRAIVAEMRMLKWMCEVTRDIEQEINS